MLSAGLAAVDDGPAFVEDVDAADEVVTFAGALGVDDSSP